MTQIQFNEALFGLQDKLRFYALSLTMEEERANDLIQETFFKALKSRKYFRHNRNFKGWVFTIMRNLFINEYRRNKKLSGLKSEGNIDYRNIMPDEKTYPSPDVSYSLAEVEKAIAGLADDYRIPLTLFLSGYKYKEIAEETGLPLGTVKSRIFFARKILKKSLSDYITV